LTLTLNGQARELHGVDEGAALEAVIAALELKADRVAVEWNGEIVTRAKWGATAVRSGDKLEVVHFVGGGSAQACPARAVVTG
jgi:thiamine biosynthesis protein ThiS